MIWLVVALVILGAIAFLKVGAFIRYDENGISLKLVVGSFPVKMRSDGRPAHNEKVQKVKTGSRGSKGRRKGKSKLWIKAVLQNWCEIFQLIGRVLVSPVLDSLFLKVSVGGSDPEACAMMYGRVCAAVSVLLPVVEATFSIKKQNIDISYDFEDEKTRIEASAAATLRVYELLSLGISALKLISNMNSFVKSNYESGADL